MTRELTIMPATALPARLDAARTALAAARDDYDRIRIRDAAAAVKAAADVWGAKDIALAAAELIRDAEIDLAKANPAPTPEEAGRRGGRGKKGVTTVVTPLPKQTKSKLRASVLPPEEEAKLRAECREEGIPVTRERAKKRKKELKDAEKAAERERLQAEARAAAKENPLPPNLFVSAVADMHRHVEAGSVDAIICDPLYGKAFVEGGGYADLGAFAAHSLKPGGLLLAILPHMHVHVVISQMIQEGLDYKWLMAWTMPGAEQKVHAAGATCMWKPWGIFRRPGKWEKDEYARDWIMSHHFDPDSKEAHAYGQSKSGIAAVIAEWVKAPNSVICDPFCGGGSTLVAAKELGHRVIGADIEAEHVETTRRKLEASLES